MHKLSPSAHIIGNHKQDRCDGRHRDQGSIRHQDNQYQQQHHRVHHSRNRCAPAVLDIRCRSRNRSGRRNAAEQCRDDISGSLCNQLHIGAVTAVDHAVRNDTGKQRFDSGKNCYRKGIRQDISDGFQTECRNGNRRQLVGNLIEIADGVDLHIQPLHHGNADEHRNQ